MALDIRGGLKKVEFNKNFYVCADELFANALDSFLTKKSRSSEAMDLRVLFSIDITNVDLYANSVTFSMTCKDNGIGLGDDERKAFITKDTSYKDDLQVEGVGKCKGSGRVQFFLYFSTIGIESIFSKDGKFFKTTANINISDKEITEGSFHVSESEKSDTEFSITLRNLNEKARRHISSQEDITDVFSAKKLKEHIFLHFLQRLVTLKNKLGNFKIEFESSYDNSEDRDSITPSDLPQMTSEATVSIEIDAEKVNFAHKSIEFKLSHYKLDKDEYPKLKNTIALCANSAIVVDITREYLKSGTIANNSIDGQFHILLIESWYLDTHVNEHRDGYNLPKSRQEEGSPGIIESKISMEELHENLEDKILEMIQPPHWDKEEMIRKIEMKYGISQSVLTDTNIRVHYGDDEESVTKRFLHKCQEEIVDDTSEILDMKEEISELVPGTDDFRQKVNKIAWKHASSLKKVDMANLSQVVVRRAAIIEVLDMAVQQKLNYQIETDGRKKDEELIHNIFFPMRKDSMEVYDHDIWLLNEEYNYYEYIASDKPLSSFKWKGSENLFDSGIDAELEEMFRKNISEHGLKRPDIAIFGDEGAAIIIEFKAPSVSMEDHVNDLMEYSHLLAAKSNGKLKQFYGYLIGSNINPNRLMGYTKFSNGRGFFATSKIVAHDNERQIGELYSEILFYEDIIARASARLEVYRSKLGMKK